MHFRLWGKRNAEIKLCDAMWWNRKKKKFQFYLNELRITSWWKKKKRKSVMTVAQTTKATEI